MKLTLLLLLAVPLGAQSFEGDVVDAVTGAPLAGARIVHQNGMDPEIVSTDRAGHFRMTTPTIYSISVSMPGYLRTQRSFMALNQPVSVPKNLRIEMTPQAVLTGAIEDEDGFPVVDARVQAMHYTIYDGERRLTSAGSFNVQTDDLGHYRISQIPAGKYYLQITPQGQWDSRYITQFRPGSATPDENQRIELKAGDERKLDVRLAKFDGVTVSGRIERPGATVSTRPPSVTLVSDGSYLMPRQLMSNGTFTVQHVPPGTYTLRVSDGIGGQPAAGDLYAEQQLKVEGSDIRNLAVTLHTVGPLEIAGKVTFEPGTAPQQVQVTLSSQYGQRTPVQTNADGSFVVKDILPGRYHVNVTPTSFPTAPITDPKEAVALIRSMVFASAIRFASKDVTDTGFEVKEKPTGPLEITIGSGLGSFKALVLDANGNPAAGAAISLQRISRGRSSGSIANSSGTVDLPYVFPGDYKVFVFPNQDSAQSLSDPDWLAAHDKDYPPLHIVAGENPAITLKIH